ncbi:MAG: hypothetical protein WCY97_07990 [Methanothrix sp.]|jgi:hypothetical protein|uniref:Uncharacterized protein n=1 Tax=Methanothrix harundinacea TaxID=301375 RepID=A0A101FV39_9EURY|nr:MAG: Uncharacterized protein XD72_0655 [Methanothrix harundinacea]KUK95139.1 MAG: Uncharacterized protein XE07_1877 [Methanothrix harundinacea]MDD3710388.1 hypothetical protein [Methanothrix sp.]MDD5767553.1 hypothetical protein [Methanothrix sp.]MDI9399957.1 hypothetical protein [Euryarchaeota archaeon]
MRSIVLLILAAMALSSVADGCCGGGGLDGVGGPKMIRDLCPIGEIIRGPHMTYAEDGRFGVALVIDPTGTSSMAFTRGGDACGLDGPCPVEPSPIEAAEPLQFGQLVTAHLDDVLVDFDARRDMWAAK